MTTTTVNATGSVRRALYAIMLAAFVLALAVALVDRYTYDMRTTDHLVPTTSPVTSP